MDVMFEDSIYTTTPCTHVRARACASARVCVNRVRLYGREKKKILGEKNNSGDYQMILINTPCYLQHKFVCFYSWLL